MPAPRKAWGGRLWRRPGWRRFPTGFRAAPSGVSAALAIEKTPPRSERSGVALRLRARGTRAMRVGAPAGAARRASAGVDVRSGVATWRRGAHEEVAAAGAKPPRRRCAISIAAMGRFVARRCAACARREVRMRPYNGGFVVRLDLADLADRVRVAAARLEALTEGR